HSDFAVTRGGRRSSLDGCPLPGACRSNEACQAEGRPRVVFCRCPRRRGRAIAFGRGPPSPRLRGGGSRCAVPDAIVLTRCTTFASPCRPGKDIYPRPLAAEGRKGARSSST